MCSDKCLVYYDLRMDSDGLCSPHHTHTHTQPYNIIVIHRHRVYRPEVGPKPNSLRATVKHLAYWECYGIGICHTEHQMLCSLSAYPTWGRGSPHWRYLHSLQAQHQPPFPNPVADGMVEESCSPDLPTAELLLLTGKEMEWDKAMERLAKYKCTSGMRVL